MTIIEAKLANIENFMDQLNLLLTEGYDSYQKYLNLGKKFRHAILIKEININLVGLILKNIQLFQEQQKNDLLEIVHHVNDWREQWDLFYEKFQPNPDDQFIFHSKVKFPNKSLERLSAYYYLNFNKKFYF